MFPNGSITDAVTNPGPRSTTFSCTLAPMDTRRSKLPWTSSHVPVDHRAPGLVRPALCNEPAVDDAQLVLVVADAELDIRRRTFDRAHEVRLDAEQLGVPALGGRDVVGEEVDGGKSSQHGGSLHRSVMVNH